mmetsp:Transcript_13396/g.33793  ORF Transcript_13396/g.33793 Transcript_13396/m.33793 type:complete len:83 (-) Transcript_13396:306-554(-)
MGAEAEAEAEEEAECLTDEVDTKGVAAQRTRFLDLLQDTCRKKAAVEVRFHGPGGTSRASPQPIITAIVTAFTSNPHALHWH